VWNNEGYYLFSDIPRNCIVQVKENGEKKDIISNSGFTNNRSIELSEQRGSNGLAYDKNGLLFICQHGNGAIATWNGNELKPFCTHYNSKPFNSPNDIVVAKDGSVFFSDPPYGLKDQKMQPEKAQPIAGFYCWRNDEIKLITDQYLYPNGVCLSPDEKSLYTCSNKPFEKFVLEFDAATLAYKRKLADENSDGLKCDKWGNLWLCTKEGIVIINTEGERLAKIELETIPANACWGGDAQKHLLVTARNNIFLIKDLLL